MPLTSWEDPPTTFISLLVATVGTSMSAPLVWADSSAGRKPRLSIKLGRERNREGPSPLLVSCSLSDGHRQLFIE